MHGMDGFMGGGWMMLFWWALIIIALVVLVKWMVGQGKPGDADRDSPLDTLKGRYAKGEISREEFQKRKKDLVD